VNFTAAVDVASLGNITLTRTTPAGGPVVSTANGLLLSANSGMVTSLTLTFANIETTGIQSGSLADGYWRLALPGLGYLSALNDTNLRRLFGDADANGTINADDFAQFGNAFGTTGTGSPFDFNNDGSINAQDFAEFGNRFGVTL
jgi:hypothetical protein